MRNIVTILTDVTQQLCDKYVLLHKSQIFVKIPLYSNNYSILKTACLT